MKKIKRHLHFAKDIIIDFVAYLLTLGLIFAYKSFALVSSITADEQTGILLIMCLVMFGIYKKTIPYIRDLHIGLQHAYLCGVCILGFALGGFSQTELQQLGFNFSDIPQQAIKQYATLKALFYAIGILVLPNLLSRSTDISPNKAELSD